MSEWIRFEDGRTRSNSEFGTITKDGRMVIANDIAQASCIVPGEYVEVYYKPLDKMIGLKRVPKKTPYSLKVTSTGPVDHPFAESLIDRRTGDKKGKANAVVSVRTLLNSRHIGLASKVKGHLYMDEVSGMLVFEFPDAPQTIEPSQHAGNQMRKKAFTERVTGDVG